MNIISIRKRIVDMDVVLVGWLFWVKRPFETVFLSISGRLPEREKEKLDERKNI